MKRLAALSALAFAAMGLQPALAQFGSDFPYPSSSTTEKVVQTWIDRYLPRDGYVVGAWSANVVMLVNVGAALNADHYPQVTTEVLSEVLRPDAAGAAGWRSAVQVETFDCVRNQYEVISSRYYQRGDRKGPSDHDDGEKVWHTPDSGATMDTVQRAACFNGEQKHKEAQAPASPFAPPVVAPQAVPQTAPQNAPTPAAKPAPTKASDAKAPEAKAAPVQAKPQRSAPASAKPAPSAKAAKPEPAKQSAPKAKPVAKPVKPAPVKTPAAKPQPAKPVATKPKPLPQPSLRGMQLAQ